MEKMDLTNNYDRTTRLYFSRNRTALHELLSKSKTLVESPFLLTLMYVYDYIQ